MLKEITSRSFTIAIFGLTVLVGVMVLTDYFDDRPKPEAYISDWQEFDYYALNEATGEAPVTILEFFDYQCSHCRDLHHNPNECSPIS